MKSKLEKIYGPETPNWAMLNAQQEQQSKSAAPQPKKTKNKRAKSQHTDPDK
jgi:hypothetical protein